MSIDDIFGDDMVKYTAKRKRQQQAYYFEKEATMLKTFFLLIASLLVPISAISFAAESSKVSAEQTLIAPKQPPGEETPLVVIYTLSTCPHCMEAIKYLHNNKIAFIDREVDTDEKHMETLMRIYDSMGVPEAKRGVPLLVIGNRIKIQGFSEEKFNSALKELTSTRK